MIKKRLIDENLVNDPVVTVEFMNLYFSVLGEVKTPGKYAITKDQISLLEAISVAGDLTIHGKRDAIFVIREEEGKRVTHWWIFVPRIYSIPRYITSNRMTWCMYSPIRCVPDNPPSMRIA